MRCQAELISLAFGAIVAGVCFFLVVVVKV
jgi:hypothetical protein